MVYFLTRNPNLGLFLESLGIEKIDMFLGHLERLTGK
jgi:hypothetical protein